MQLDLHTSSFLDQRASDPEQDPTVHLGQLEVYRTTLPWNSPLGSGFLIQVFLSDGQVVTLVKAGHV